MELEELSEKAMVLRARYNTAAAIPSTVF